MKWLFSFILLFSQVVHADEKTFKDNLKTHIQIHKDRADYLISKRSDIVGIEIVIADRASNIASRFGHALIRFVDKNGLWANDLVVSFGALSETEKLSLVKGVFGGYKILPEIMSFHEYWNRYTQNENRDLRRFVLNLDKKQLNQFLDVTFNYIKNPEKLKNYTFAKNNCVGVISKFLIEANLTVDDKQAIVPARVHKWLKKNQLTVFPELTMKNPASLEKRVSTVDLHNMSHSELIKEFNIQELSYIYFNKQELSFSQIEGISSYLLANNFVADDAFSFTDIASKLYKRCHSENCFQEFNRYEKEMKNKDQLDIIAYRLKENSDLQKSYLTHRTYQKWDLIRGKGLKISENQYKLTLKNNQIHFSANAIKIEQSGTQKVAAILQFTIKDNIVTLLDEEVGQIVEGKLVLKEDLKLVLHQEGEEQVFSLIKV